MAVKLLHLHSKKNRALVRSPVFAYVKGFTILELMMVIAIVAIMTAVAAPPMGRMIDNNKMSKAASDLSWSLLYARSEAVKRNQTINVTRVGTDWSDGWEVKFGVQVLQGFDAMEDITVSGPSTLEFLPNGRVKLTGDNSFVLKAENSSAPLHCVYLNQSGVTTVLVDRNGDGNCANG